MHVHTDTMRRAEDDESMTREEFAEAYPAYAHTWDWDEHPDGYDDVCACAECRSYGG